MKTSLALMASLIAVMATAPSAVMAANQIIKQAPPLSWCGNTTTNCTPAKPEITEGDLIEAEFRMFTCLQQHPIQDGVYGNSWDEFKGKVLAPAEALCGREYLAVWAKATNDNDEGARLWVDVVIAGMLGCQVEHEGGPVICRQARRKAP